MIKSLENLSLSSQKLLKVCVASLAIGDKYLEKYNASFRFNHEMYCKKHDYDFYVVDDYIDNCVRDPSVSSLQKALICEMPWAKKYDLLIYIDADTIFTAGAPPIHKIYIDQGKIGIIDEYSQPTREGRIETQRAMGWEDSARRYYEIHGFDLDTFMVLNTGVMVLCPNIHATEMRSIFTSGINKAVNHPRGFHYEQALIGFHMQLNKSYYVLDNEWNAVWALQKLNPHNNLDLSKFADANHIVHFAGGIDADQASTIDPYRK